MPVASVRERLVASLKEVGLINPPWLRCQPGGPGFQVVTGARRLMAAADLGWQVITARLVPEGTPDFYCLLVHVMDNAFSRGSTSGSRPPWRFGCLAIATGRPWQPDTFPTWACRHPRQFFPAWSRRLAWRPLAAVGGRRPPGSHRRGPAG